MRKIPLLNLEDFLAGGERREKFVVALATIITTDGFVRIAGHGIVASDIERGYTMLRDLFALGPNILKKYTFPHMQGGIIPLKVEKGDGAKHPDIKICWHQWQPNPSTELRVTYPTPVPEEVPGFSEAMLSLYFSLEDVGKHMLRAIALALGWQEERLVDMVTGGPTILRGIEYPPIKEDDLGVRSHEHTDINFITILITSEGEGLEILAPDGTWIPVNNGPDEIIVNTADMLKAVTGGQVRSVIHRVTNPADPEKRKRARYSMPLFVHPKDNVVLDPACSFVRNNRRLTAGMFLNLRLYQIRVGGKRKPKWFTGPNRVPLSRKKKVVEEVAYAKAA